MRRRWKEVEKTRAEKGREQRAIDWLFILPANLQSTYSRQANAKEATVSPTTFNQLNAYIKRESKRRLYTMTKSKPENAVQSVEENAAIQLGKPHPLSSSCMLVSLKISVWSGRREDGRAKAAIATVHGNKKSAVTASKYLIRQEAMAGVTQATSRLREVHYRYTLPWLDEGARVLGAEAFWKYQGEVAPLIEAFDQAADGLIAEYPKLLAEAPGLLGTLYDATQYPSQSELREKFAASLSFMPFPSQEDFRVKGLGKAADVIKQSLADIPDEMAKATKAEISKRVVEVAGKMVERLKAYTGGKDGYFKDSLVENVQDLVAVLPMLNITADAKVEEIIKQLEAISRVDVEDLRKDPELRKETAKDAQGIVDKMKDFV